jgi:hypothetical protein
VTQVQVSFDQHITLPTNPADAFHLARLSDGAIVVLHAVADDTGAGTVVTLTFTGGAVQGVSLADGRYQLTVLADQIGGPNGSLGGDFVLTGDPATNKLFRLFGDVNGDGTVNGLDLSGFRQVFGLNSLSGSPFDFNGDGAINGFDLAQFRLRFGSTI